MKKLMCLLFLSLPVSASNYISVADYGNDFDTAAIAARVEAQATQSASLYGHVYVPPGNYCLQAPTEEAVWHLAPGAEFHCQDNYPNGIDNISFLKGDVWKLSARGRNTSILFGDTDFGPYASIRHSVTPGAAAKLSVVGDESGAIAAYATTGDGDFSEGHIALQGYCINTASIKQNCWSGYFESHRAPWGGPTTSIEVTTGNWGKFDNWTRILPSGNYGYALGIVAGINISGPATNGPYNGIYEHAKIGAGIMFSAGTSGMGMDAGVVCTNAALAHSSAKECIRMGVGQTIMWHGSGYSPKGWISATASGELTLSVEGGAVYRFTADGLVLPSGRVLN